MLNRLQHLLLQALRTPDPKAALKEALKEDTTLTEQERECLRFADEDGLRVTRLVLQKLRYQRLLADPELADWFATDIAEFAKAFRAYDAAVPPRSVFPRDEVEAFRVWRSEQ